MKKQANSNDKVLNAKAVVAHVKANAPKGKVSAAKAVKHVDAKLKQISSRFLVI